jgi:sugar phosphate isomerase/epimerase
LYWGITVALKLAINTMTFNVQSVDFLRMAQAISKAGFSGMDIRGSHIQQDLETNRENQTQYQY